MHTQASVAGTVYRNAAMSPRKERIYSVKIMSHIARWVQACAHLSQGWKTLGGLCAVLRSDCLEAIWPQLRLGSGADHAAGRSASSITTGSLIPGLSSSN